MQHCLNLRPLPQGQGSLRPGDGLDRGGVFIAGMVGPDAVPRKSLDSRVPIHKHERA
jgi:hypothetical protein